MNNFWKYIGVIGSIASVIGTLLAIYFYNLSNEIRQPVFLEDHNKLIVIDSSSIISAPITIFDLDSNRIIDNVVSTNFYFWNNGLKSIKKSEVLDSILIYLPSNDEILDFNILKESRSICKIDLNKINQNSLRLNFNILEKGDGFSAQILYKGGKEDALQVKGVIEGVKHFTSEGELKKYEIGFFILIILGSITVPLLTWYGFALTHGIKQYYMKTGKVTDSISIANNMFLDNDGDSKKIKKILLAFFFIALIGGLVYYWQSSNFTPTNKEQFIPIEILIK